jgi:hypothetical protein
MNKALPLWDTILVKQLAIDLKPKLIKPILRCSERLNIFGSSALLYWIFELAQRGYQRSQLGISNPWLMETCDRFATACLIPGESGRKKAGVSSCWQRSLWDPCFSLRRCYVDIVE